MDAVTIQKRIDALRSAMDSGVLTVRHGDTSTTYRTQSEMERALRRLESDLKVANGTSRKGIRYIEQVRKNL